MFLKEHRQAFLLVPKSCQKVMVIVVISHLKNHLTFARAPCNSFEISFFTKIVSLVVACSSLLSRLQSNGSCPGNAYAHLNSEGGSISTVYLLVLTGKETAVSR